MKIVEHNIICGIVQEFVYKENRLFYNTLMGTIEKSFEDSSKHNLVDFIALNSEYSDYDYLIRFYCYKPQMITSESVPYSIIIMYFNKNEEKKHATILLNKDNSFYCHSYMYIWGDALIKKVCLEAEPTKIYIQTLYYNDGYGALLSKKDVYESYGDF